MSAYEIRSEVSGIVGPSEIQGLAMPVIQSIAELAPDGGSVEVADIERLFAYAMRDDSLAPTGKDEGDIWLAPRLHYLLRLSRRFASNKGFWTWLVLSQPACWAYVRRRWSNDGGGITPYRYQGAHTRNALARLWWYAEMSRNGTDYSPVRSVFTRAVTAQAAMELKYSSYRAAVQAFVNVAEGVVGERKVDDPALLSKKINAYLSVRSLETIGVSDEAEDDYDSAWRDSAPNFEEVLKDERLVGPKDGTCSPEAIRSLEDWFLEIAGVKRK